MRREEWKEYKGHEETFGGEEYVHYLDCSDGFMSIYIFHNLQIVQNCINFHNFKIVHFKYIQFSIMSQ